MNIARSLHIGINDYGGEADLQGCVNDALHWEEWAAGRGAQTTLLRDGNATKATMAEAIDAEVQRLKRGETLFLSYSGHGTYVRDLDGDEPDGRDEALCPADVMRTGEVLTDDELLETFTNRPYGSRIVFASDSCHSGTVARFAEPFGPGRRSRFLPPATFTRRDGLLPANEAPRVLRRFKYKSTALLLSGCDDPQVSYDAFISDVWQGAFSYAALRAYVQKKPTTYRDWYAAIRALLPNSQYPQVPQLTGTGAQKRWQI